MGQQKFLKDELISMKIMSKDIKRIDRLRTKHVDGRPESRWSVVRRALDALEERKIQT